MWFPPSYSSALLHGECVWSANLWQVVHIFDHKHDIPYIMSGVSCKHWKMWSMCLRCCTSFTTNRKYHTLCLGCPVTLEDVKHVSQMLYIFYHKQEIPYIMSGMPCKHWKMWSMCLRCCTSFTTNRKYHTLCLGCPVTLEDVKHVSQMLYIFYHKQEIPYIMSGMPCKHWKMWSMCLRCCTSFTTNRKYHTLCLGCPVTLEDVKHVSQMLYIFYHKQEIPYIMSGMPCKHWKMWSMCLRCCTSSTTNRKYHTLCLGCPVSTGRCEACVSDASHLLPETGHSIHYVWGFLCILEDVKYVSQMLQIF